MKLIKVGAGVLNQTPLDWDGNRDRIITAIHAAQRQQTLPLLLHQLLRHQDGVLDPGHGAHGPEQQTRPVHQPRVHLDRAGLGEVGAVPGVGLARVLQHHGGPGRGLRGGPARPQDVDPGGISPQDVGPDGISEPQIPEGRQ